jgi:hypothetical protein
MEKAAMSTVTQRRRHSLTRLACPLLVMVATAPALPTAASAATGAAPGACYYDTHVYSATGACVTDVTGWGRGADAASFRHLGGTATYQHEVYWPCPSHLSASGTPTYFAVQPSTWPSRRSP